MNNRTILANRNDKKILLPFFVDADVQARGRGDGNMDRGDEEERVTGSV